MWPASQRFCSVPAAINIVDTDAQLAQVGVGQAQCSYYYRHAGNTALFDNSASPFVPTHIKLDNLGLNRNGLPIRALAMDTEFLCSPALAAYNVLPSTHHQQMYANILFADGHAAAPAQHGRPLRGEPGQCCGSRQRFRPDPLRPGAGRHRVLTTHE